MSIKSTGEHVVGFAATNNSLTGARASPVELPELPVASAPVQPMLGALMPPNASVISLNYQTPFAHSGNLGSVIE
jgi:hypothetical protein